LSDAADSSTPVFRWSGQYLGFLSHRWLFDAGGRYLGWCESDGTVWRGDGKPLGQLVEGHYVLRNLTRSSPVPRTPRVPPVPPSLPRPAAPRLPCIPRPGWVDGLDGLGQMPSREEFAGLWVDRERSLRVLGDGTYCWCEGEDRVELGQWSLEGDLLRLLPEAASVEVVYRIVAYSADAVTLRWFAATGLGLPVVLRRSGTRESR